jgi:hypothetical protein
MHQQKRACHPQRKVKIILMESTTAVPAIIIRYAMPDGQLSDLVRWFHGLISKKQAQGLKWARDHAISVNVRRRRKRKATPAERRARKAACMRRYRAKCKLAIRLAAAEIRRTDWDAWKADQDALAELRRLNRQVWKDRQKGIR